MNAVAPAVVDRGPTAPTVAVVAGIHGDEPSGVQAVRRLLGDRPDLQRGVRFILANPPAYLANERFLDIDLNRAFPGDADSTDRETRLAAQVRELTDGLPTLSLHSTLSHPEPMAIVPLESEIAELAAKLPLRHVIDRSPLVGGAFVTCDSVVTVETGCQFTEDATVTAVEQTRAFLALTGALDAPVPKCKPTFYRRDEVVRKPPNASVYELRVDDFERVEPGTTFATADDEVFVADEAFVPILMSETGYDDIFGYKGTVIGESLEEARAATSSVSP